jgi:hypothetical protein
MEKKMKKNILFVWMSVLILSSGAFAAEAEQSNPVMSAAVPGGISPAGTMPPASDEGNFGPSPSDLPSSPVVGENDMPGTPSNLEPGMDQPADMGNDGSASVPQGGNENESGFKKELGELNDAVSRLVELIG